MVDVSVIVPCYNQGEYLDDSLQSVFNQGFENWECIIIDDGSTDNSAVIASQWVAKDHRFKLVSINNAGVSNARNQGIDNAQGTFILPLDADDYINSNYLERAVAIFKNTPTYKVVYGKAMLVGDKQGLWELPSFNLKALALANTIYVSAMFKKEDYLRIGGYDLTMDKGLEDWEFWIRLLKEDPQVFFLNELCFYYRIKKTSRNTLLTPDNIQAIKSYIVKKHYNFYINTLGTYHDIAQRSHYQEMQLQAFRNSFIFRGFMIFSKLKKRIKSIIT
ncbi:glycosyltransferase [Nonlabens sp.]|uniref:glycosyltransferase family 2 protein n=1 Tax=Nonlabens sp. TaxID=1888209 RepID=UPI001BCBB12F|nr:glycosyltransferase [Nonlabens sp.]